MRRYRKTGGNLYRSRYGRRHMQVCRRCLRKPEPVSEQTEVQSIAPVATPESKEDDFFERLHRWSQGMRLHQSLLSARRPLR